MRPFRVYLDGSLIQERFECMGKYDVANILFPYVPDGKSGFADISVAREDGDEFEVVLHQYGNKRLLAVFL